MMRFGPKLEVGEIVSALAAVQKEEKKAALPAGAAALISGENEIFGDLAPFCEPSWYQDSYSPVGILY